MTLRTFALISILLVPLSTLANEDFPAPFGLRWDMSEAELKSVGFSHTTTNGGLDLYASVSVPKSWSKGDTYLAVFYQGNLVKLAANSIHFTDDVYGTEGKKTYSQLKNLLTKKYGQPTNQLERVGLSLYDDSDEFYQCLEYSGCGAYATVFEYAGGTIGISLNGVRRGEGYLTIGYESPAFSRAKRAIEQRDASADEDTF